MADAYVGTRSTPQESQTQDSAGDARLKEEADVRLAETLSGTIEDANERVVPIVDRIREVRRVTLRWHQLVGINISRK